MTKAEIKRLVDAVIEAARKNGVPEVEVRSISKIRRLSAPCLTEFMASTGRNACTGPYGTHAIHDRWGTANDGIPRILRQGLCRPHCRPGDVDAVPASRLVGSSQYTSSKMMSTGSSRGRENRPASDFLSQHMDKVRVISIVPGSLIPIRSAVLPF
jgi:hypothetical protein